MSLSKKYRNSSVLAGDGRKKKKKEKGRGDREKCELTVWSELSEPDCMIA